MLLTWGIRQCLYLSSLNQRWTIISGVLVSFTVHSDWLADVIFPRTTFLHTKRIMTNLTAMVKKGLQFLLSLKGRIARITHGYAVNSSDELLPRRPLFHHHQHCQTQKTVPFSFQGDCDAGQKLHRWLKGGFDFISEPFLCRFTHCIQVIRILYAFSNSKLPSFRNMPTHWRPKLITLIILSTGFLQEWFGAVLPTTRRSRFKFRNRATSTSCTEKVRRWSGPPSVYTKRTLLLPIFRIRIE